MRNLTKLEKPQVLADNETAWLAAFLGDLENPTKRYRYRHTDIKSQLVQETGTKCIYCESKIGHNTPGDVEHKIPTSADANKHFDWENLTIACTECNRRKNAYFDPANPFVDPYTDDVEAMFIHEGPVVLARDGIDRAEIAVRILDLMSAERIPLIAQKIEKIDSTKNALRLYASEPNGLLKKLRSKALEKMMERDAEYSAMVTSVLERLGFVPD